METWPSLRRVEILYRATKKRKRVSEKVHEYDIIYRIFRSLVAHSDLAVPSEETMRELIHARLVPSFFQRTLPHRMQAALDIQFVKPLPEYQEGADLLEDIQSSFIRNNLRLMEINAGRTTSQKIMIRYYPSRPDCIDILFKMDRAEPEDEQIYATFQNEDSYEQCAQGSFVLTRFADANKFPYKFMRRTQEINLEATRQAPVPLMVPNPMIFLGECELGDEKDTVKCQAEEPDGNRTTVVCEKDDDGIAAKDHVEEDKVEINTPFLKPLTVTNEITTKKTNYCFRNLEHREKISRPYSTYNKGKWEPDDKPVEPQLPWEVYVCDVPADIQLLDRADVVFSFRIHRHTYQVHNSLINALYNRLLTIPI